MTSSIELYDLTKRYGRTTAVDGLTLRVAPGRVTGFVGPNGSGKSTTMRMVLGLQRPTRGHALVGGRPYRTLRHPLRQVGALLEAAAELRPTRPLQPPGWPTATRSPAAVSTTSSAWSAR